MAYCRLLLFGDVVIILYYCATFMWYILYYCATFMWYIHLRVHATSSSVHSAKLISCLGLGFPSSFFFFFLIEKKSFFI